MNRHLKDEELQQILDNDGPAVKLEQFRQHLDECSLCRSELQTYRNLFSTLREADHAEEKYELETTVMATIRKQDASVFTWLTVIISTLLVPVLMWIITLLFPSINLQKLSHSVSFAWIATLKDYLLSLGNHSIFHGEFMFYVFTGILVLSFYMVLEKILHKQSIKGFMMLA